MKKILLLVLFGTLFLFICVSVIVSIGGYSLLNASLIVMDGEVELDGLEDEVEIAFDEYGVPNIDAKNRNDAARALGYLHARERIFSMDMQRRFAAGELAEVIGGPGLRLDKKNRLYGFRGRAKADLAALSHSETSWLEAYCDGINFGINSLKVRPWELLILGVEIEPWRPEDSLLVGYAMYLNLQGKMPERERVRSVMKSYLSEEVYSFFTDNGSAWDSTIDGSQLPHLKIPGEMSFDYLKHHREDIAENGNTKFFHSFDSEQLTPGSNVWAISGKYTEDGAAMLANDMHLSLNVPNIWYRANISYKKGDEKVNLYGATLPGMPLMVIGSNGSIAWGFTNSGVDTFDFIELELDPQNEERYLTKEGSEVFEFRNEIFKIKGKKDIAKTYKISRWGPVVIDRMKTPFAMRWKALEGTGINLQLGGFEEIKTVEEALTISPKIEMPTLNLVLGDKQGSIAWSLIGPVMVRENYEGDVPVLSSEVEPLWNRLEDSLYPKIVNPEKGYVWNANNRSMGKESYLKIFHGDTAIPARAHQIASRLSSLEYPVEERDLLDVQMDIEARFYFRWRDLLVETLLRERDSGDLRYSEMRKIVEAWDGRADADSTGFLLVRDFRKIVFTHVYEHLMRVCFEKYPDFNPRHFRSEEPLWKIVSEQPDYLCDPRFENWHEYLIFSVSDQLQIYSETYGVGFKFGDIKWGNVNISKISHPLSSSIPFIDKWIDMKNISLSGDGYVINVMRSKFGPSERMVVSPGNEGNGIFHMPAGQSGHPLSDYYRKGHDEWLQGIPIPLLGREKVHRLVLFPRE